MLLAILGVLRIVLDWDLRLLSKLLLRVYYLLSNLRGDYLGGLLVWGDLLKRLLNLLAGNLGVLRGCC